MSQIERFPCDTCGGDMHFAPERSALECPHCGAEQEIEGHATPWGGSAISEIDLRKGLQQSLSEDYTEEVQTIACDNCGAHVEYDPETHATECPFCATPVVTGAATERLIKPRAVLPFALSEPAARKAMTDWLGSLWFAPGGLQEYARKGRALDGIYVPYWTYDADTKSRYTGQRGTVYYVEKQVRVMVDGKAQMRTRREQKIRWTNVRGRVARFFDDVLVLASQSLPKRYTDNLAPWDLTALEPYVPQYLAGFRSEAYTVPLEDGLQEARAIMNRQIERDVRFDIGGDRQKISTLDTQVSGETFKHILLPVWMAAYKYRGKTYRFVVNGQSGRVQGERPWSWVKIALAVVAVALIALAVGFVAGQS